MIERLPIVRPEFTTGAQELVRGPRGKAVNSNDESNSPFRRPLETSYARESAP